MKRIEAWLFPTASPVQPALLRAGLCAILAARLTRTVYVGLAAQAPALYRPRSFMHVFSAMPSPPVTIALQCIAGLAAVCAMLGWKTKFTLPLAFVPALVLNGMGTSLGKVVHNDVLLTLCLLVLLPAPCADTLALDARGRAAPNPSQRYGWPARTMLVIVAGSYFFSGWHKLLTSGPGWVTGDNMRWVMFEAARATTRFTGTIALAIARRSWLAHVIAGSILLIEITFPIVLFSRRARPWYAAAAVLFHLGTWLTIGLDYWAQAAVVTLVLLVCAHPAVPVDAATTRAPLEHLAPAT